MRPTLFEFAGGEAAFRALRAYMRWADDNVMSYSAEDAVVASDIPMPRWDWRGPQAI